MHTNTHLAQRNGWVNCNIRTKQVLQCPSRSLGYSFVLFFQPPVTVRGGKHTVKRMKSPRHRHCCATWRQLQVHQYNHSVHQRYCHWPRYCTEPPPQQNKNNYNNTCMRFLTAPLPGNCTPSKFMQSGKWYQALICSSVRIWSKLFKKISLHFCRAALPWFATKVLAPS